MINDSEIDCLKNELEHEKTYREAAAWHNSEIEKHIMLIQDELRKDDYTSEYDADLQKETARSKQLIEGNEMLKEQLPIIREKIKNAKMCGADCKLKHDDLNINLDILTQAELLRVVKKFERSKTDLVSTIRSREWRLDSESKLYVRLNDQRTYLQNELLICQNNIAKLQRDGPLSRYHNQQRMMENRILDPKRAPIKKILHNEKLPPIMA